jgi:hypothetical protein
MKSYRGGEVQLNSFFTSALKGVEWSTSRPGRSTRAKNTDTHLTGYGVSTRAGVDDLVPAEFETQTAKRVARSLSCLLINKQSHFKMKYFKQFFYNQHVPLLLFITMPQVLLPTARRLQLTQS